MNKWTIQEMKNFFHLKYEKDKLWTLQLHDILYFVSWASTDDEKLWKEDAEEQKFLFDEK